MLSKLLKHLKEEKIVAIAYESEDEQKENWTCKDCHIIGNEIQMLEHQLELHHFVYRKEEYVTRY